MANNYSSSSNRRVDSTEVTVFGLIRYNWAPILQRVAQWQGYTQFEDRLLKQGAVLVVAQEMKQAKTVVEKDQDKSGQVDYAATSR
jgi:hypothetical protein